ncbi:hypothetical protein [Micromonospora fulviviridis]|uniref:Uncharacterized protein n=1 Tax=Micromonospora fulviviridis TaxID=47860 RepID=A0ABV2VFC1_9ACTN
MTRPGRPRRWLRWVRRRSTNLSHRASGPPATPGPTLPTKQPAWNAPTVIDWRAAGLLTTPAQRWRGNGGQR